jgi:hypothetical protein
MIRKKNRREVEMKAVLVMKRTKRTKRTKRMKTRV